MANATDIGFEHRLERFSKLVGLAVSAAAVLVLLDWALDVPSLTSLLPALVTMKANTAAAFVLIGVCLWLSRPRAGAATLRPIDWVGQIMAAIVVGLGLLTLGEYAFGWNLGIDHMLFDDPLRSSATAPPGRMAPITAVNLTLLGAALLLIDIETRGGKRPSNWLALAIAAGSFLAIVGHLYGVDSLYKIAAMASMALHTAILFVVCSIALVCARPGASFVRQIAADTAGGLILRRLLPAAILVPPFIGWLRWQGELDGHYSTAFGLAIFVATNVAIFATLVWWSARALQRIHEQRVAVSQTSDWQQAMLNSADFSMVSTDPLGVIRTINAGGASMLGYAAAELVGASPAVIHDPAEVAARAQALSQELGYPVEAGFDTFVAKARRGLTDENDWTYIRKDGSRFPVRVSVTRLTDASGKLTGFFGIGKNISALKIAEEALRESEQRLRMITDNVPALISYIDREQRFRFNNSTYARWLGRPLAEITGRRLDEVYDAPMYELFRPHLEKALKGTPASFEFASPALGRFIRGTYIPDVNSENEVIGVYGHINDISMQQEVEAKLRQLAQFDSLTGLPNRSRFNDKLAEAIARSERSGDALGVIFLDLDNFKGINDTLGHEGGDLVLQEFAKRLSYTVRSTDTVARLAGDEFVIILESLKHTGDAGLVAAKIVAAMQAPFRIFNEQRAVSTSMGVALHRSGEADGAALLRRADAALYKVKASGRGCFLVDDSTESGVTELATIL